MHGVFDSSKMHLNSFNLFKTGLYVSDITVKIAFVINLHVFRNIMLFYFKTFIELCSLSKSKSHESWNS